MTRQLDVIDLLLERGADINARRLDGALPIHLTNGDYGYRGWRDVPGHVTTTPNDVFKHLAARGANVDVWMAAVKGDIDRVRTLIDGDPSLVNRVNDYNSYYAGCGSALKNAAVAGHIEIVRLLLERGTDPNLPEEGIAPNGHALYSAV
ncbi:MAG: ankyrin repeat domain-containing protein [Gemmatimonadaceae bacterium]